MTWLTSWTFWMILTPLLVGWARLSMTAYLALEPEAEDAERPGFMEVVFIGPFYLIAFFFVRLTRLLK